MVLYVILAENISKGLATQFVSLCEKLQLSYYLMHSYTSGKDVVRDYAVGPMTKGDKDQICSCLSGSEYIIMEAKKHEAN